MRESRPQAAPKVLLLDLQSGKQSVLLGSLCHDFCGCKNTGSVVTKAQVEETIQRLAVEGEGGMSTTGRKCYCFSSCLRIFHEG